MDRDTHKSTASAGSPTGEPPSFLQKLDLTQWKLTGMPVSTMIREWPDGSIDTLIVLSADTAYGRREDVCQRLMTQKRGTADVVAQLMQDLPAPGTPEASSDPVPVRAELLP